MSGGFGVGLGALFGGVLFDSMETGHVGGGSAEPMRRLTPKSQLASESACRMEGALGG